MEREPRWAGTARRPRRSRLPLDSRLPLATLLSGRASGARYALRSSGTLPTILAICAVDTGHAGTTILSVSARLTCYPRRARTAALTCWALGSSGTRRAYGTGHLLDLLDVSNSGGLWPERRPSEGSGCEHR